MNNEFATIGGSVAAFSIIVAAYCNWKKGISFRECASFFACWLLLPIGIIACSGKLLFILTAFDEAIRIEGRELFTFGITLSAMSYILIVVMIHMFCSIEAMLTCSTFSPANLPIAKRRLIITLRHALITGYWILFAIIIVCLFNCPIP